MVEASVTPAQTLQRAQGETYDAITVEVRPSTLGGLSLVENIRNEPHNRAAPVIGLIVPATRGADASFAIADVLCKPIRVEQVIAAMARFKLPRPGRANVMVIDDDSLALDLMQRVLADMGIESSCLSDGRAALRDIDSLRPDAIILDLMMPGFDGFEVLDALQHLPAWSGTPVFIWTSMILTDEEHLRLSLSARAILSKGGGSLENMLYALRRWRPPGEIARQSQLS